MLVAGVGGSYVVAGWYGAQARGRAPGKRVLMGWAPGIVTVISLGYR